LSLNPASFLLACRYVDTFCADNEYRKEQGGKYTFMDAPEQHVSWFKGNVSNVVPGEALPFFRDIMKQGKAQGMGGFEVDCMNYQLSLYARFSQEPGGVNRLWATGARWG